jgi:hypothetical protein
LSFKISYWRLCAFVWRGMSSYWWCQ